MKPTKTNASTLPIYVQITELLIRDIAAGRLIDGERLPPERDMAETLNVSVGTLRKSLAELTEKGFLERIQGSGNYIRAGGETKSVYAMFRLELLEGGGLPRAEVLDVQWMAKPDGLTEFGTSTHASRIRRLRFLNDTMIAVEEIWLDGSYGQVRPEQLSDSLYHYYQRQLGFWITRAEDRVGIGHIPDWSPERFPLHPGAVSGFVERLSWADQPTPAEYSRTWFDTTKALYVQRLM